MSGASGHATRLGLVRCEHCQRQFNPHSAARHIPWCKKQQSDSKKHRLTADKLQALERYKWRIGYKPTNKFHQQQTTNAKTIRGHLCADEHNEQHHITYRRGPSSVNSSSHSGGAATLSSPSASSTTSLSNSIASTLNQQQHQGFKSQEQHNKTQAAPGRQRQSASRQSTAASDQLRLKRSASSVGLVKGRGGDTGSASSKNSRISTTTTTIRALEPQRRDSLASRAKSVSDLANTNMSELVETLAKRMEQIYVQNQLLLKSIINSSGGGGSGNEPHTCDRQEKVRRASPAAAAADGQELEFDQCHHCRAKCLVEANYCHKCGCKMRPSNPTPPPSSD